VNQPHFEVYQDDRNQWRWRLRAANGEIVASSESYTTHAKALKGVDAVRTAAERAVLER
jgi:uncharacterized protein YegP (UPF0339 family)